MFCFVSFAFEKEFKIKKELLQQQKSNGWGEEGWGGQVKVSAADELSHVEMCPRLLGLGHV